MSTGYLNRVIRLEFPEFSSGPDDPIWIVIRNPKLVPPAELQGDVALNPDGTPVDMAAATDNTYRIVSQLVVGWRVYDASAPVELDPGTGEVVGDQPLLPLPATIENARKLPSAFILAIADEVKAANNPR